METPKFEDKEYDDNKRLREDLTKALKDLQVLIGKVEQQFPVGGIAYWIKGETLPNGFAQANGTKGAVDITKAEIIPIQRTR